MVKKTGLKSISLLGLLCIFTFIFAFSNSVEAAPVSEGSIVSDDFSALTLNTSLWTFINPKNDAAYNIAGNGTKNATLSIFVPGGFLNNHDFYDGKNDSPRIMQNASNTDFEIEVKFQSQLNSMGQMEGVLIQEDLNKYIRFDFEHNLLNTNIFVGTFENGSNNEIVNTPISSSPVPLYMQIKRAGDQWTINYSSDGMNWITGTSFPYQLNVTSVGPFVGNSLDYLYTAPAYTGIIDYFFNTDAPIVPEDLSRFNLSGSKINASDDSLIPGWNITLKKDLIETKIPTNETGFYEFKDILEGTYTVFEEQRPGWMNLTPTSFEITGTDQDIQVNFENIPIIPTFNISGYKFNASDSTGIAGWNITITNGTITTSVLTNIDGSYEFTNLVNDTYTVFEELRSSDWINLTPASQIKIISGQDQIVNFTNLPIIHTYNVSGYKINGSDGTGISGWNITITNGTDHISTLTDSYGYYEFTNIVNGTYTVFEEQRPEWRSITPTFRELNINGQNKQNVNFTNIPLVILSDDFSDTNLNTSIWTTIINPLNDSNFTMTGTGTRNALLSIMVPEGVHEMLGDNKNAPRILQNASNKDFEIEVKFQSPITSNKQIQGVIIQQDNNNFIRFDFGSDGLNTRIFASTFANGIMTSVQSKIISGLPSADSLYMRIKRSGNDWTMNHSSNGMDWAFGFTFTHILNVTSVGPFAGNKGFSPPAFTSLIDYFFNTEYVVVPEDESKYSISGYKINGSDGSGLPGWNITVKNGAFQESTVTNDTGFYNFPYLLNGTYTLLEEIKPEWINVTPVSRTIKIDGEGIPNMNFTNKPLVIVSDDFSAPTLRTPLWTIIDPLNDSTIKIVGSGTRNASLSLFVPATTQHDFWDGINDVPRIMQNASNNDFEIEVKFQSQMTSVNQMEGIIIQQDANKYISFVFERDWVQTNILASTFDIGTYPVVTSTTPISSSPVPLYMRVKRTGDDWTMNYSLDGTNWSMGPSFPYALTVTSVGPFVGQSGLGYLPPAYTGLIDYFFNTESPVVPEDPSKFNLSGFKINASDNSTMANWKITLVNSTINTSKVTDPDGFYEFTDLVEGTYTVSEEKRSGWKNVTSRSVEINSIDQDVRVNFTNQPIIPAYTVSGYKINASDGKGIAGWNITIKEGANQTSKFTNETGYYEFTDLLNGTYTVSEELRSLDWTNLTPSSRDITILGEDKIVNFTNQPIIHTYNVSGFKINESDSQGLSGWNISITNGTDQISTLTDSNGFFEFTNLVNGTYTVFEELRPEWLNVTSLSRQVTIQGQDLTNENFTNKPLVIVSDDFSAQMLNTSIWTTSDPKNDANFALVGYGTKNALLSITVPSNNGTHQIWEGKNEAPKIMQNASNKDFEIDVKFQSRVDSKYQMQGVIIQQDINKFIRYDFESDGLNTKIFAATFASGTGTPVVSNVTDGIIGASPSPDSLYMRVKRTGNQWILKYSLDGMNWTTGFNFQYVLNVTSVGPFIGNAGFPTPAHTGLIDYFFNTNSPIIPEDAPPVGTKFNLSGYKINASDGKGLSGWNITITDGTNVTSTLTDIDGSYKFTNLLKGNYTVSEEPQPEWVNITPLSRGIIIQYEDVSNVNFTNKPLIHTYNVSGYKINSSDEQGISNWMITITNGTNPVSTLTNDTGFYKFTNLVNGTYTVFEEQRPSDWINLTPLSVEIDILGLDVQVDFRNQPIIHTYNVSGYKINATDGKGLSGWNITITNGSNPRSTLTDGTGFYEFTNLINDTYTVTEEQRPDWMNVTDASRQVIVSGNDSLNVNFTNKPRFIVSDDFSAPALNTSLWRFINPLNDGTFAIEGTGSHDAVLRLAIPGGKSHDIYIGNNASQMLQNVFNTDFEVEVKFQSIFTTSDVIRGYQMQGVIIEQDSENFLRFDFYSNGNKTYVYAANITGGTPLTISNIYIGNVSSSPIPLYMRIKRSGNNWTQNYSNDGINWTNSASFNKTLTVASVGPFIGNKNYQTYPVPAFTGLIDYFFNTQSPIDPEDVVKSNLSGFVISDINSNGSWDTGEQGIPDWKVSLFNSTTGLEISNTTTNSSGKYTFYNLLDGTYILTEETQPDYIATNSTSKVISIFAKDINNLNFTNYLPQIPPIITTQPVNQTLKLGDKATFSVVAVGTKNLTYQWQKNNVNITNAKGTSYTTLKTTMSDNGTTFRVIVTNPLGNNTSIPAKLTVRNIVSDDFNTPTLNASTWVVVDPTGDALITMESTGTLNASLNITIPGGISHDAWGVNNAPRVLQTADNSDFEIEAKFLSKFSSPTQEQGIIIQQDNSNYLRFDFSRYSSTNTRVYAASIINGNGATKSSIPITPGDNPMYMRVKRIGNQWTQNYSFDGINWNTSASFSQILTVTSVGPFVGNSNYLTSPVPAFSGQIDYFFNTSSPVDPEDVVDTTAPEITLWYGKSQRFGFADKPQKWVNILGNANDPSGVASMNYSLNNGSAQFLSIGPDTLRLQSTGDFNVEIDKSLFLCGNNILVINATDNAGNSKNETVSVNYICNNVVSKNHTVNWSNVASIQDAGQIADGLWIKETNSIRPVNIGYDRLITIGNMTWDDYEISVPITLNAPLDPAAPSGGPNFGVGMRWQGHFDDGHQPRDKWYPLGALGLYIWNKSTNDFVLKLVGTNNKAIGYDTSGMHLLPGVTYIFKMRAETAGSNTLYSLKVWEKNTLEPDSWTISSLGVPGELKQGSMTLNSHYSDVSFGNVSIRELEDPPLNISSISVEPLGNSATVHWNTNKVATSNVTYGLTTAYENGSVVDGTMLFSHTVTLTNLTAGTLYHYKINSTDKGGNSTNTSDLNFTTKQVSVITSDDFSAPALNTSIWMIIDPIGDANFTIEGTGTSDAVLNITIPGGTAHDAYLPTNNAPRLMQSVSNSDFEVEAKFQSVMTSAYQETGIIIEQDSNNYLRFDFTSDSPTTIRVYSGAFINGIRTYQNIIGGLTPVKPLYMKVNRTGSQWKQSYSYDGINWIPGASFSQVITVNSIGPFVGNAGTPTPAFTGLIDYFYNTKSPIMPEDPTAPTLPSITVQPANQTTLNGSKATFNVVASGTEPLSYQWKKNNVDIIDATGPSYTTPALNLSDTGTKFKVVVSNVLGNVTSNESTLSVIEAPPITWWDAARHFRIPVTVNAASFERYEKPVEITLNFTRELSLLGQTGSLDETSIRIVEINSLGAILNPDVQFQFDKDAGFNALTKASGTVVFIMNGTTPANGNRYYQIYFGLTGVSYSPLVVAPQVTLTDNIMDEGQSSYQIAAAGSTYFFQKQAGGFSSLVDASDNDWINFHPTPTLSAGGDYRGIPNVYGGGIFHPGHKNATSSIVSQGPIKIRVKAVSINGLWESFWDFYPGYATMTMTKAGGNYWWLYEGTPGGLLEPDKDFMVRSDNKKILLSQSTLDDIATQEWAYFSDPTVDRSLFVSHHEDDTLRDEYHPMDGLMTVFGFGRKSSPTAATLSSVPQKFTMGLMDGTEFGQSAKTVYSAYKDMKITKGVVEQIDNSNAPIIITQPADRNVAPGMPVTFNVGAAGLLPLSYQWQKNGVNITGATSASYTTPSANVSDNGSTFSVVVTNSIGSNTSTSAKLTVPAQQVVMLDVSHEHNTTVYSVPPTNSDSGKAFSKFNIPSGIPGNLVSPINYAGGKLYQRLEVLTKPSTKTVRYQLCVFQDAIIPEKHACSESSTLKFTGPGTYYVNQSMSTLYQYNNISWDRSLLLEMLVVNDINGIPVDDRYGWLGQWSGSPDMSLYYPMQVRYTAKMVPPGGGEPVWDSIPVINTNPTSQLIEVGKTATFNVVATGTAPLFYQWQKNGVNISGAQSSSYSTPPLALDDNGSTYNVIVTNEIGSVNSNAAKLNVSTAPPQIGLLDNPGFESGKTSWTFYTNTAGPTFNVISPGYEGNNAANIAFSKIGTNMQLYQSNIKLEPNTRYRLSFAAKSNLGHDVRVRLFKQVSPYPMYGLDYTAPLTSNWAEFTTEFNTSGFATNVTNGRIQFYFVPYAKAGDTYNIDKVVLEKVIATPPTPPAVIGNAPTGTNVPVTTSISVNFSKPMNQASAQSAFSTIPATTGSFGWSGNVMIYTPGSNLNYSTTYNVTVGTGARDLEGNNMTAAYNWQFTTVTDTTPPEVMGSTPTGTNVPVTTKMTVTFTEAMNQSSVESAFSSPNTTGTFSWIGNVMTYTPDSNLNYSTTYNVSIGTGAKDISENNMAVPYEWNFTTMDQDSTPPTVSDNSPTGSDVSLAAKISVNFSEAMNTASAQSAFSTTPATNGTFSWIGNNMTYTPDSNLSYNTTYNVTIGTGAKDLSGNTLVNLLDWQFITVSDTIPPQVIGKTPTGSNIPIASQITVTFSEAMNTASVESVFSTSPATIGSFSWSANTMTYTPVSSLSSGTTYNVIVGSGALDLAGNNMPSYTWQFITLQNNLILNPGFESGKTSWTLYTNTAGPTFNAAPPGYEGNNAANLAFSKVGTNMQLYQSAISLEPNTRYRVSFAAKSNLGHDVRVRLFKQVSPYPMYGLDYTANLDTNWAEFTTEFNTSGFATNVTNGRIQFYFVPYAKAGDTYNIDNVVLEKVIATPPIPPAVIGNAPTGTNVPVTTKISVNFSKPMNQASAQSAFSTIPATTGSFGWSGNVMTYTPASNLNYSTTYSVTVGTGAMDSTGNNISSSFNWQFTTIQDTTAPTVIGKTPTGANIPVTTKITVTFSEAMNNTSAESAFSSPNTTGTFSWIGNTMTYTPDSNLAYLTTYNVIAGTGAKDLAGNNMAVPYEWNFTTMDLDSTPPTVSDNSPTGSDVSLTAKISVNFSEAMNKSSAQAAFFTTQSTNGSFSWIGNNMTYTPDSNLSYNTAYSVTIGTGAKDLAGNNIQLSYAWPFNTVSDTTPPAVMSKTPTGSNIPIASVITVTFSEAMNTASVESVFSTSPATTGSFNWNANSMTYTPVSSLSSGTAYNVIIGSGAMDLAGNNMPSYSWQFNTTVANLILNPGFESGKTSWTLYTNTAGPTFNAAPPGYEGNNAANLAFSKIGTNMQLYQSNIKLEPNTRYRVSFAAKSALGHDVRVRLFKQVSPYPMYGLDYTANLDTNWAEFTTEFNTSGFTTNVTNGRIQFYFVPFATVGDTYNIDNVVLEKVIAAPPAPPAVIGNAPTGTNVPVTTKISVNFSKPMNQTSAQSAVSTIPATSGTFSWNGNNMTYIPTSNLSYNTAYNVTIGTGAKDLAGNNMLSSRTWQFTTVSETAPTVGGKTPTGTTVPVTTIITVTFSKAMNNTSAESAFLTSPATTGTFSWSGNVMTYTPTSNLDYGTIYTATVGTGAKDLAGNNMQLPYNWNFTTLTLDISPPEVIGKSPTVSNAPVTTQIIVIFNESMNTSSVESALFTSPATTGSFGWSGNVMTYTPTLNLEYSTTYTVTVGTGAMDLSGNNMQSNFDWQFTTVPDPAPLSVLGTTPDGIDIPATAQLTVTFSKAMNILSTESAFSTSPGTNGSFSWSGNTMTYTPDSNLEYGTIYTATVGIGAKDLAGNSLSLPYNWNFTTLTPDTTAPTVNGNTPTGTDVSLTAKIVVIFSEAMNTSSAQSAFSISPAVPTGSFSWNANTMTYTPGSNLEFGTTYNVTVGTGAMDLAGNYLSSPYENNFTTVYPDTTVPEVIGKSPSSGTSGVPVTAKIIVNFSEEMNHASVESAFITIPGTTGNFSWNGNNMTYTPSNLNYNTLYNVIIQNTARDLAGNTMLSVGWSFTTISDTTSPGIIDNTPAGSNIPVASAITVTFSEAMNTASVESAFSISPNTTGSFSWNGNKLTFTPALSLSYGTIYDVTIGSGAMDLAGNNMPAYTWQFTTVVSTSINLVLNSGFESGKTSWSFYTNGAGTFTAATPGYEGNYSAKIVLSTKGSNMQLYQSAINLESNTRYRLSFAGAATYGHDVRVKLFSSTVPSNSYGLDYIAPLDSSWGVVTTEFTTPVFTAPVTDGRLQFYLVPFAQAGDIYNIDDVVLEIIS